MWDESTEEAREEFDSLVYDILREPDVAAPTVLYHYTSAAGLKGILKTGCVWATDNNYLNDPDELRAGTKIVRDLVGELVANDPSQSPLLSSILEAEDLVSPITGVDDRAYIASFSARKDDLYQWLHYGDGGKGFAIGVSIVDAPWRSVLYSKEDFQDRVRGLVSKLDETFNAILDRHPTVDVGGFTDHAARVLLKLLEWACRYKDKAYEHEQEWRLLADVRWHTDRHQLCVRERASRLIPYTQLTLWQRGTKTPISEIVLGPLQDEVTGRHAVEVLWYSLGFGSEPDNKQPPLIRKSEINYRQV